MSYESIINEHREKRESLLKKFQNEASEKETSFSYFPIDQKWRVPAVVEIRKPKDAMEDHKLKFKRIGKISFELEENPHKFSLYEVEDDFGKDLYIYLKDGTSSVTSYGVGRFVKVIKEDESNFFVDFNLAFTPACGHIEASACPWARESSPVSIEAGEKYIPKS